MAYELFGQLGGRAPGTVVLPTGYGELLFGVAKGFRELRELGLTDTMPKMLSAEPAVRAPLEHAMTGNLPAAEVSGPPSLAAGIACMVSSVRATAALRNSGGSALTFREDTLVEAANLLAHEGRLAGIFRSGRDRGVARSEPTRRKARSPHRCRLDLKRSKRRFPGNLGRVGGSVSGDARSRYRLAAGSMRARWSSNSQLSVSYDGSDPPEALLSVARTADAAGAPNMWIADPPFLSRTDRLAPVKLLWRRAGRWARC